LYPKVYKKDTINKIMPKKSHRIELDSNEREILEELKDFFNIKTTNGVLRHLIKISNQKYLK